MQVITAEYLRAVIVYDEATGIFRWRHRPALSASRNSMFEGKPAGHKTTQGYLRIEIDGRNYLAHRLAWLYVTGNWPAGEIDHINMDKGDNRIENLRDASHSQNQGNRKAYSNNTSGLKGVTWYKKYNKWHAQIRVAGRQRHICYSECPAAAYLYYVVEADKSFGEFARVA